MPGAGRAVPVSGYVPAGPAGGGGRGGLLPGQRKLRHPPRRPAPDFRAGISGPGPGGLFLFDVKTPSALEGADGQTYLDEDDGLFCVWRADYYPRRRVCGYGLDLFLRQEDGSWSRDGEYHEEYAYTMEELRGFLQDAGFQAVRLYGDKTMSAPKESAQRVFFAAKKER